MLNQSTVMTDLIFNETEVLGSSQWEERMSTIGKALIDKGVRQILLVHGTFAGNDALGLFDLLEPIEQEVTGFTTLSKLLKVKGKDLLDRIAGDIGNYTPEYVESMGNALGRQIDCKLFTWGSGNFHLARLRGVVDLAEDLAGSISSQEMAENDRLLLLGHSHAGQLFALLTTLLEGGDKAQHLCQAIRMSQRTGDTDKLLVNLDIIRTVKLDIVTFGTPVRYAWGRYDRYRLLAIVNHRTPIRFSGLLATRDGDYIQQWGAEGTDIIPPYESDLNDSLDALLDKGRNLSILFRHLQSEALAFPHYADGTGFSTNLCIDYKDNADSLLDNFDITHCVKTLFGHGVYTENRAMLFNLDTVVKAFY